MCRFFQLRNRNRSAPVKNADDEWDTKISRQSSSYRRISKAIFAAPRLAVHKLDVCSNGGCPNRTDYRHRRRQLVRWIGDLRSAGLGAFNAARITISIRASGIGRCDRWRYHSNGPREPTGLPGRFIVFQVGMFGAALLAAVPNKWVRSVGFVILLAGMYMTGLSVGALYLPTFFAFVWVMV